MIEEQERRCVPLTRDELIWLQCAASYYSGNVLECYMKGQRPSGFDGRSGNKLSFEDLELAPPKLETETAILEEINRLFGLLYEMNPALLELGKWFIGAELDNEDDPGSSPAFDALVKKYYGDEDK
jgi:hypothetical protein